jgi:hypothetical protein
MHVWASFWQAECDSLNCQKLLELLGPANYGLLIASMTFIEHCAGHVHNLLTWTEAKLVPLAPFLPGKVASLREELVAGTVALRFGALVDKAIARLPHAVAHQV